MSDERSCPTCGNARGLNERGYCKNKSACLRRVTQAMVTKPYVGGFDPEQAYNEAPKGEAA